MSRDGSGIYHQPFPDVAPGTTIESAVYNGFTRDVEQDLNAVRPIIAGGTGANNAQTARTNLKAEVSSQQVTNYDTHPFESGSFFSDSAATGAPSAFASGVAMVYGPSEITLEAWSYAGGTIGQHFVRQKQGGVWQPWHATAGTAEETTAYNDARYVNLTGDTMTGNLGFGDGNYYIGMYDPTHPIMAFEGGHYWMYDRAAHSLNLALGTTSYGFGPTYFNSSVPMNAPAFNTPASAVSTLGDIYAVRSANEGVVFFGSAGTHYIHFNGGSFNFTEPVNVTGALASGSLTVTGNIVVTGTIAASSTIQGGTTSGTIAASAGPANSFQTMSAGAAHAAYMTFHRPGAYAVNIGLDTDNVFKIGGFSLAGVSYPIWHSGYTGTVNVLNATASSSPTTGALTVAGGVGVGGSLNVGAAGSGAAIATGGHATSTINNTAGANIGQDFAVYETNGQPVAYFNRFGSVGALLSFSSAGTFSGSISVSGATCAYNTSSDMRLKEDLKSFDAGNIIDDTEVYDFKWKDTEDRAYGVMAQQAKDVYATPFSYEKEPDRWMVDYSKYVPVLLQELKALRMRVAELEGRVGVKPS